MRLATFTTILALAIAGTAHADALGSKVDGHWTYPGQRLANNALVDGYVTWSADFWSGRSVGVCPHPTVWLADDLGQGIDGRADRSTCEMWLRTDLVQLAQSADVDERLTGQVALCDTELHESGHLGGLGHLPESTPGIMNPGGDAADDIERRWGRRGVYAHGTGACGRYVASRYNARSRTARASRRLTGRHS